MKESQNVEWKENWRDEYLKWICGFANAQGGKIYIGISDNGNVTGIENAKKLLEEIPNKIVTWLGIVCDVNLHTKENKEYIEIIIPKSNMPIAYKGIYHYRSGSTKQELKGNALQDFLLKKMGMSWDNMTDESITENDIDKDAIKYFQDMAVNNKRMNREAVSQDINVVLENLNLISEDGKYKKAVGLLFGRRPEKYAPSPIFRIGRFKANDADLIFQDEINCDLIRMADRVMEVLKSKYLTSPIHYEGLQRIEELEIPEDALREAIFNAIIHKDYTGAHIQMKVWDDRIELWNEGNLPFDMSIENLLGKHSSKPRNKNIASVFYKAGFIESWGRGILKIREGFESAGFKTPEFKEDCGGLLVTLYRISMEKHPKNIRKTSEKHPKELVYDYIKKHRESSRKEIKEYCNLTDGQFKHAIKVLKENDKIDVIGSAKNTKYIAK